MAAESIEIKLLVDGETAATRALNNVTGQMTKLDSAQKQAATSAKLQATGFTNAAQGAAKFQSTLGLASSAIGQFSGNGAKMVSMLGQTAGAMATVSATMGPLGIAIVAVTSAVSLATVAFDAMGGEVEKTKAEMDALLPTLSEVISKMRSVNAERALMSAVRAGRGTAEQQAGYLQQQENSMMSLAANLDTTRQALNADRDNPVAQMQYARASELFSRANEERNRAQQMLTAAQRDEAEIQKLDDAAKKRRQDEANERRSSGRGGSAPADRFANADASGFDPFSYRNIHGIQGGPGKSLDELMTGGGGEDAFLGDLAKTGKSDLEAYNDELGKTAEMYSGLAETVGGPIVDAFDAMVNAQGNVGKALQASFKASLAGISKTEAVKGLSELAAGFGQLAIGNAPSATSHFEASGLHFAAAALAGGAAAAIPGGGGGGRGGGGGGRAAGPTASGQGGGGYSGPATIVVNWNQPAVLASTYADAGKQIQRAIREAEGRYGSG